MKFLGFLGLVSQGVGLQFVHVMGYIGLAAALAAGWRRLPSWLSVVLGVVLGVITNYVSDLTDLLAMLHNYHDSEKGAGGFLVLVYVIIAVFGYVVGAYSRAEIESRKAGSAAK